MAARPNPAALAATLNRAADLAGPLLGRCIDQGLEAMMDAERRAVQSATRNELSLAMAELSRARDAWLMAYPNALQKVFRQIQVEDAEKAAPEDKEDSGPAPLERKGGAAPARDDRNRDFGALDGLSLVDEATLSRGIESSRLLQVAGSMMEQSLQQLNAYVGALQGFARMQPDRNPLRPEVFVRGLEQLMTDKPLPTLASVSVVYRYLARPLGSELSGLYDTLVAQLQVSGAKPVGFRVIAQPNAPRSGAAKDNGGGTGEGGSGGGGGGSGGGSGGGNFWPADGWDPNSVEVMEAGLDEFLAHGGSVPGLRQNLGATYYERVEAEIVRIAALRGQISQAPLVVPAASVDASLPPVDRPRPAVQVSSQLREDWGVLADAVERELARAKLLKEATESTQVLGVQAVRGLVSEVVTDERLIGPVREAMVALEPSLMRLAMQSPEFFRDEEHPGRQFMEAVAQRSFKYNDELSPGFQAFMAPVAETVKSLSAQALATQESFQQALQTLEDQWAGQDQQEAEARARMVEALQYAEDRQKLADQIAWEISLRPDLAGVPNMVLDFIYGQWSLVMAHARLKSDGSEMDPGGYGAVINDLIWSVKAENTLREPKRLIAMVPPLVRTLHEGLRMLGQHPRESEGFFDALLTLHDPVLRLRLAKRRKDGLDSLPVPLEGSPAVDSSGMPLESGQVVIDSGRMALMAHDPYRQGERVQPQRGERLWLGESEQEAAGFEETQPPAFDDSSSLDSKSMGDSNEELDTSSVDALLDGLATGTWVDLCTKQRWVRAQVVFAGERGRVFMMVSEGGQPHTMTRRSCARLVKGRSLRLVPSHEVVGQALGNMRQRRRQKSNKSAQPD